MIYIHPDSHAQFANKCLFLHGWCGVSTTVTVLYLAIFLCTGTAVLEFNYEGEARESFRTPSFWKQKRRAARFATSSSLFLTYLVVISSDFNTDFCVAHTAVRR